MNTWLSRLRSRSGRTLLAQLVMASSVLVALASSPPPRWLVAQPTLAQLSFVEQSEYRAILSIELGGELYADANYGDLHIYAEANRTASDLELSVGPPRADAAEGASLGEAEADFRAGTSEEDPDVLSARADVQTPNVVRLQLPLKCLEAPGKQRAESCVEQFAITLTRHSERPLSVDLELTVALGGDQPATPPGTFEVTLEELAP